MAVEPALQRIALAAGSRLIVTNSINDAFIDARVVEARGLRLGNPRREEIEIGPVVLHAHRDKGMGYLQQG